MNLLSLGVSLPGPWGVSPWLVVPTGLILLALLLWARTASRPGRLLVFLSGVLLVLLAMDPVLMHRYRLNNQLRGAFVVDGSASVWLHTGASPDKLKMMFEEAEGILADKQIDWSWFLTGDSLAGPFASSNELMTTLHTIRPGLQTNRSQLSSLIEQGFDFVLLLGDGNWHDDAGAGNQMLPAVQVELPLNWRHGPDIGFRSIQTEAYGLLRHPVRIQFELDAIDIPDDTVVQIVVGSGSSSAMTNVTVPKGSSTVAGTLDLVVTSLGHRTYPIQLRQVPSWDRLSANNKSLVNIDGYREKLRTLLISGAPGPDTRFIRKALKSDPLVELMHFSILRTEKNKPGAPNDQLSLIPFPYHELFTTMMPQFDLVILQNFDFRTYFRTRYPIYFRNLAESVRNSGTGLIVTGGPLSFGAGEYQHTTVPGLAGMRLNPGDWKSYPEAVTVHSIRGNNFPMPPRGLRIVDRNRVDSVTASLAAVNSKEPLPIVTYRRAGQGRVVTLLSSSILDQGLQQGLDLEGWIQELIRWTAGDSDENTGTIKISPTEGSRIISLALEAPKGVTAYVTGSSIPGNDLYFTESGFPQIITLSTDAVAQVQVTFYKQGSRKETRILYVDPLSRERGDLWRTPKSDISFRALEDFDRDSLDRYGVRTAHLRGQKLTHLAARSDLIGLIAVLALTGWFLIRRSGRSLRRSTKQ